MCGIAGIIKANGSGIDHSDIRCMLDQIKHRGPDGDGVHVQDNIGIGHRRLSIIDIELGRQPMCNEDGSVWITFNGEIYNYKELKKLLIQAGHVFKSNSDTEVIIHGYEEWGKEVLTRLRGMFAFVIIDYKAAICLLARDHIGIKPLLYVQSDGFFAFASELNALRAIKDISLTGSLEAIDLFLQFEYIPAPHTIFKEIRKLLPGHYMTVNFSGEIQSCEPYWEATVEPENKFTLTEWVNRVDEALTESVKAHLVADVPFGVFLSGGIDSTLIAMKMKQLTKSELHAFTIGFNSEAFNEIKFAEIAAKKLGIRLHSEIITESTLNLLDALINQYYGEPFGDSSAIPTWYVSKLARSHVPMVLSGDGADEFFAGYDLYAGYLSKHPKQILKRKIKNAEYIGLPRFVLGSLKEYYLNGCSFNHYSEWKDARTNMGYHVRSQIWNKNYTKFSQSTDSLFKASADKAKKFDRLSFAQYIDMHHYLPNDILVKVDIASMSHGLEVRPPFIDKELIKLSGSIPSEAKLGTTGSTMKTKVLLKKILEPVFDDSFINRKKQGFAIPKYSWLFNDANLAEIRERILDQRSALSKFFNLDEIEKLLFKNNGVTHEAQIWLLLVLSLWLDKNKDVVFN